MQLWKRLAQLPVSVPAALAIRFKRRGCRERLALKLRYIWLLLMPATLPSPGPRQAGKQICSAGSARAVRSSSCRDRLYTARATFGTSLCHPKHEGRQLCKLRFCVCSIRGWRLIAGMSHRTVRKHPPWLPGSTSASSQRPVAISRGRCPPDHQLEKRNAACCIPALIIMEEVANKLKNMWSRKGKKGFKGSGNVLGSAPQKQEVLLGVSVSALDLAARIPYHVWLASATHKLVQQCWVASS